MGIVAAGWMHRGSKGLHWLLSLDRLRRRRMKARNSIRRHPESFTALRATTRDKSRKPKRYNDLGE
jgi:hypothetical protein